MDSFTSHRGTRVAGRVAGAALIALIAAGCTPTATSPTPAPTATPSEVTVPTSEEALGAEANPVAVAQRFYDAVLNGEDEVLCQLLTQRYRDALIRTQATATCPAASATSFAEIRARHGQTPLQFTARDARIAADGQSAVVRVSGGLAPQQGRGNPQLNDATLPLVRSGVDWLVDPPLQTAAPQSA